MNNNLNEELNIEYVEAELDKDDLAEEKIEKLSEDKKQIVEEHIFDTYKRKIEKYLKNALKSNSEELNYPFLYNINLFKNNIDINKYELDILKSDNSEETEESLKEFYINLFINKTWDIGKKRYLLYNHINERKFFVVWAEVVLDSLRSYDVSMEEPENHESLSFLSNTKVYEDLFFKISHILVEQLDSRYWLSGKKSALEIYLKEVENISNEISLDEEIPYCEENKDRLIKQNLKAVIGTAKKYQGLGLDLDDLISAGNLGLCIAWNKFDPERAQAKENVLKAVKQYYNKNKKDIFTKDECMQIFTDVFSYGKRIDFLSEKLPAEITYQALLRFIDKYIQSAKFSSVANSWIRAYILSELDTNSRIVKKPKADIYADKEKTGSFVKETIYDISAPISNERGSSSGITLGDLLGNVVLRPSIEIKEEQQLFKRALSRMMGGLKARDKRIVFKKFGIGVPRELTPKEIAESENISVARVSQILQSSFAHIQRNIGEDNIDYNIEELFYLAQSMQ